MCKLPLQELYFGVVVILNFCFLQENRHILLQLYLQVHNLPLQLYLQVCKLPLQELYFGVVVILNISFCIKLKHKLLQHLLQACKVPLQTQIILQLYLQERKLALQ